jgi:hypothetical protein
MVLPVIPALADGITKPPPPKTTPARRTFLRDIA